MKRKEKDIKFVLTFFILLVKNPIKAHQTLDSTLIIKILIKFFFFSFFSKKSTNLDGASREG
jgi:L-lactate permease